MASKRGIGLLGAIAIGIGGMVGGGIFAVLGEAVALADGATAAAFLVAGAIAVLTAYSYAKLSVTCPSQGGTVAFVDEAFGVDLATGTLNNFLWLSYLVTIALYAVAFGSYAATFFGGQPVAWVAHLLISAAIVLPVGINLTSSAIVSESETAVVVLKLALLAVVIVSGFPYVDPSRIAPASWGSPLAIATAGLVIFVAYEGFELIANSALEVRDPERTLPRAFYGAVGIVVVLYVLVALITTGTLTAGEVARAKDYALAAAARPALGEIGFRIVAASALLATFSAINATVYGNARLGYTLAKDGEMPDVLAHRAFDEPAEGVVIVGALALLIANLVDLEAIAILASAGFLLVFAVVNAAGVKLAPRTGGSRSVSGAGCVACLAALVTLLARTWGDDPRAVGIFVGFLASSAVFEVVYRRWRGRRLRIPRRVSRTSRASPARAPSPPASRVS